MDYWVTLVDEAANNCGANLTREQVLSIANDVKIGHEQYGMAYYEPPASEAYQRLEQEWRVRYVELERRFNAYRDRAEAAVARTVGCRDHVTIEPRWYKWLTAKGWNRAHLVDCALQGKHAICGSAPYPASAGLPGYTAGD